MPANSFQNTKTPDNNYAPPCGELHLLDEGDRDSSWDLFDTSISTTWEECDLSGRVPKGTKALYGELVAWKGDQHIILLIRDGAGSETNSPRTQTLQIFDNSTVDSIIGTPVILKATDGVFDYREHAATHEVTEVHFCLWGYFI
jgi:hypothetical protein